MSYPDYSQRAEDHQCFLVAVEQVGTSLNKKEFQQLFDRVSRVQYVRIERQKRVIWVRYKRDYNIDNNEWGDFQAHRKVLGLLSFGKCGPLYNMDKLKQKYESSKMSYASTMFDSRLIVYGKGYSEELVLNCVSQEGVPNAEVQDPLRTSVNSDTKDQNGNVGGTADESSESTNTQVEGSEQSTERSDQNHSSDTGSSSKEQGRPRSESNKSELVYYSSMQDCQGLEEVVEDFVASLFWVLESKRLDRSTERLDKIQLLMTPFEKKESVGVDTESKVYKKRCQGRLRKHLGDLCLLAGLPGEALLHYQTCLDMLKSSSDWMWLAGAYEGLCSASVILMRNAALEHSPMRRNLSFTALGGVSPADEAAMKATGSKKSRYANGLDLADGRGKQCLLPDDVVDKYKEAIMLYSKYKMAGIVEMEASLKACRILITQRKYLEASEFLQNVVYINLQLSEDEKTQRYSTLSQLYQQIGFHRKASFFKLVAAMQCISQQNSNQAWVQRYHLLLQSLEGYKLPLDARSIPHDHANGWPVVQTRLLHELIHSARKMGNPVLAVRHLTFLVHAMHDFMSVTERREMCNTLEACTSKSEGTTTSITLDTGMVLPPVPLSRFPIVKSFKLSNLTPHMRPAKMRSAAVATETNSSPFIYSPMSITSRQRKESERAILDFQWVEGEVSEVAMQVYNPLPFELKVANMGLVSEGVDLEVYPASFTLPPESGPHPVKVMVVPKTTGVLTVTGYTSHVLGVRSTCMLEDLPAIGSDSYEVEVIPSLPQMMLSTSLPQAASFSSSSDSAIVVTSASITLYAGQSCECQVTLTNKGKDPIHTVDVSLESKLRGDITRRIYEWNEENLMSQLPLQPQTQACLTMYIHGASSFLNLEPSNTGSKYSLSSQTELSGNQSIEALLKVRYSGGPGQSHGYCRQCAVSLNVEILPSLVFAKWNILPTDSCDRSHVVLDVENTTSHEMGLSYSGSPSMVVEGYHSLRICVPVEKYHGEDESGLSTADLLPMMQQYLASAIDIRWRMASTGATGKVSLEFLQWLAEHLEALMLSPIHIGVTLNSQLYKSGSNVIFESGSLVSVGVELHNKSDHVLGSCQLCVKCIQDGQNGRLRQPETDLVLVGGDTCCFPMVGPDGRARHAVDVVFLSAGHYQLDIACTGHFRDMSSSETSIQGSTGPSLPEIQTEPVKQRWRYLPMVEVEIYNSG